MTGYHDNLRHRIMRWFVEKILRARWVRTDYPDQNYQEMGIRVLGINLWYYKWPEPMVAPSIPWQFARKYDFGECVPTSHVGLYDPNDQSCIKCERCVECMYNMASCKRGGQ